jgi:chloramphenicol O-acetyltransferase
MSRKGHKVKDVTGMQNIMFDLKPNRCEAEVFMSSNIDVTEFVKYIKKLKEENNDVTFFHGFVDIMGKIIYQYPKLNRFVQNRTLYEHDEVSIAFVAKAEFNDKSEEFMTCLPIGKDDTILDISKNLKLRIDKIRDKKSTANTDGANNIVDKIGHAWRPFRSFLVGILKWVDKKFGLPGSIADENIYYSSIIVSNIGTFRVPGIYHNLANLGTSSGLVTFGDIKEDKGKYTMNLGITLDERIADGFYFCRALKAIEFLFAHPELMMEKASKHFEIPEYVHTKDETKKVKK